MSFSGRVRRGTGANILRQVINIGTEVAVVPIALAGWGDRLYGEWQVLSAAMMYIVMLDFGTHTYAINRMNQCFAKGQMVEFGRNLHTALAIALAAGAIGALAAVSISFAVPVREWFNLDVTSDSRARQVLILIALQTAMALPVGVIAGVYRATGEYARDIMVNNSYRLLTAILTAAIIFARGEILAVAWMQLICYAAVLAFIVLDIRRRHTNIEVGVRLADWKLVPSFLLPSSLFFTIQTASSMVIYGMILIVANTAGAAAVAAFTVTRTLVNAIPQVVNSISGTLWPEFTAMEARGDYANLQALHQLAAKTILFLGIASAVFLHYAGAGVLELWTNGRVRPAQQLIDALVLLELLATWSLASQTVLAAANRPRILAISQLIAAAVGLGIGYFAAVRFGPAGVVWGLLAANIVTVAWIVPRAACMLLTADSASFVKRVLGQGICVLAALLIFVGIVVPQLPDTGPAGVFGIWLCTAAGSSVLFRWTWLTTVEWRMLKSFLPWRTEPASLPRGRGIGYEIRDAV